MIVDSFDDEEYKNQFRVAIFGSARIKRNEPSYKNIYDLSRMIAGENIDIVTGGGPGIMEAANKGHSEGRPDNSCRSFGLNIKLPYEQIPNRHLDVYREFEHFSNRLDTFMQLSNVVVVAPGGVGTLLEFVYTWQLLQVELKNIPIILLGEVWRHFLIWVEEYPVKQGYISKEDLDNLFFAETNQEAFEIIKRFYEKFKDMRSK